MKAAPFDLPQVICPYCKADAQLIMSTAELYNGRDFGAAWICRPCDAWIGVHKNSPRFMPLGRLANAELRKAKQAAHAMFDNLWQRKASRDKKTVKKSNARSDGYHWLAEQLGIPFEKCHIGMFDVETCKRVVEICEPYYPKQKTKKEPGKARSATDYFYA